MAITKYKVIKKNLEAVINYAMNGEKTENGILVSAINCLPKTAYSQMMLTKKATKERDIAKSRITTTQPTTPSSSAIIEKMKSLCGSGMYKYFWVLFPSPTPKSPP